MKKRWRRAPRQVLRRDMERRRPHPLARAMAQLVENLAKAVNALAKGCVKLRDAFYLALLDEGGDGKENRPRGNADGCRG